MLAAGQEIPCVIKQIVKVQKRGLPLIVGVQFCKRFEFGDELSESTCRYRGYEGCISIAAPVIICLRSIRELRAAWFAEAPGCRRAFPFPFLPPSAETSFCAMLAVGGNVEEEFRQTPSGECASARFIDEALEFL